MYRLKLRHAPGLPTKYRSRADRLASLVVRHDQTHRLWALATRMLPRGLVVALVNQQPF